MRPATALCATLAALFGFLSFASSARADGTVPDNGAGTADLPIRLPYGHVTGRSPEPHWTIIDGLPSGTTMEIDAIFTQPLTSTETPGGAFPGGTIATSTDMTMPMTITGTGSLSGYSRSLVVPLAQWEQHNGPRGSAKATTVFSTDLFALTGQITGDPDFDLLRITAGTGFGMPSPGQTILQFDGGGSYYVDSFFDVFYRIDFVGAPGGPHAGRSGSTTATIRMAAFPEPSALVAVGMLAIAACRRHR